jgi:hypothetical protein
MRPPVRVILLKRNIKRAGTSCMFFSSTARAATYAADLSARVLRCDLNVDSPDTAALCTALEFPENHWATAIKSRRERDAVFIATQSTRTTARRTRNALKRYFLSASIPRRATRDKGRRICKGQGD